MELVDTLLFVDANQYLNLYETATGKKLLAPLKEQKDHIFVTAQVVDEVQRRKVEVTARFLTREFQKLNMSHFPIPEHLFGATGEKVERLRKELQHIHENIDGAKKELIGLAHDLLMQISRSEDPVSKTLIEVFAKAEQCTEAELNHARERKERGNAPGKTTNPLGDQVSWEQVLSQCQTKKGLWIISRDEDYATKYENEVFLNAQLYQELIGAQPNLEVFCFNNIPDGLKHFADTTKVKAEELLTRDETEEIKREQDSLPPLGWLPTDVVAFPSLFEDWKPRRGFLTMTSGLTSAWNYPMANPQKKDSDDS